MECCLQRLVTRGFTSFNLTKITPDINGGVKLSSTLLHALHRAGAFNLRFKKSES